ncbi:hypothetical protein ACFLWI_05960 [Chloroflexota bacterium]
MLNSYSTTKENKTPIPVQRGFWGQDKYLADSKQKVAQIYFKNPQIAESEKRVILEYWQQYEGLPQILDGKLSDFISWFLKSTSPETITRSLRALKEDGTIRLNQEQKRERQEKELEYRQFWGNEKGLRGDNGQQ